LILGLTGVTVIELSAGTLTTVLPTTPLSVAVIVLVPVATPVITPLLFTLATVGVTEFHVTWLVTFCVVPPE
jgi:hypothetical protein